MSIQKKIAISHLAQFTRALHLVWKFSPFWTVINGVLLTVQGFLPVIELYLMKLIIDAITAGVGSPDVSAVFHKVLGYIAAAGGVALFGTFCRLASGLTGEFQALVVADGIQDVLHTKSIEVDLEYYENPSYFDTLHRAQKEAPFRPVTMVNNLISAARNGISLVGVAVLLISFHWLFALVLFIAALPSMAVRLVFSGNLYRWYRKNTSTERRSWYYNWILTGGAYAREIRLFELGRLFIERFHHLRKQLRTEKLGLARKRSISEFFSETAAVCAIFGAFAFISLRTITGAITLGSMVMYLQAFQRGQSFLSQMLQSLARLYEDNLFIANYFEFLSVEPKITEPSAPQKLPEPLLKGIVFDRVGFKYPGGTRPVLDKISLSIAPGEHVALVGENGAGKSTFIKLLCRLYDPVEGTITVDGIDLRDISPVAWRRKITGILQDYSKYHATVRENIWYGNILLPEDTQRVTDAAERTGASTLIQSLPRGYDTMLGKWFEGGEELSAGEWQKIALSRAFVRDAPIVVLDEPTVALDARAEYDLFENFHQLTKGRTAILISHRLSTVRMADRIFVVANGVIEESGTHRELMEKNGRYAELYGMQAGQYRGDPVPLPNTP